jgi:hypothetical protein
MGILENRVARQIAPRDVLANFANVEIIVALVSFPIAPSDVEVVTQYHRVVSHWLGVWEKASSSRLGRMRQAGSGRRFSQWSRASRSSLDTPQVRTSSAQGLFSAWEYLPSSSALSSQLAHKEVHSK